jgi:hypothetical protein
MKFSKLERKLEECSEEEKTGSRVEVRLTAHTIRKLAKQFENGELQEDELGVVSLELQRVNGKLYFTEEQLIRKKDKSEERIKEKVRIEELER